MLRRQAERCGRIGKQRRYEARGEIREIQSMRKILFFVAGFEDRKRGPWAKECRQPLGAENGRGTW